MGSHPEDVEEVKTRSGKALDHAKDFGRSIFSVRGKGWRTVQGGISEKIKARAQEHSQR